MLSDLASRLWTPREPVRFVAPLLPRADVLVFGPQGSGELQNRRVELPPTWPPFRWCFECGTGWRGDMACWACGPEAARCPAQAPI